MPRKKLARPNYRLRRRGDVWAVEWTDPLSGRTRSVSTRASERGAAEIWLAQWIAGQEQPLPPKQPLIVDVVDHYLADRKPRVAAYDTLEWAAGGIKRHVGSLEPRMLGRRTYAERRARDGVADGSIRREVGVLRAALATAVRDGWIEAVPYVEMPPMPAPRDRWLTRDEVAVLVAAAGTPHTRMFIVLAYHTAARAGAILDLCWDQVDLDRRLISYDRLGRKKSKKRRAVVPINVAALAELQAARQAAVSDHVIEFRGKPVASIKNGFRAACRRAGIAECVPHVLRHTAASHMVMDGVPLSQVARMLGDSEATVERVYAKFSPDYLRDAAASLVGPIVSATVSQKRFSTQGIPRPQTPQAATAKTAKR
jgi:integrase